MPVKHKIVIILALLSQIFTSQTLLASNDVPDAVELAVLRSLYEQTNGSGWTNQTNWPDLTNWPETATSAEFGTWSGVTVQNGDITKIILNHNNLTGNIPIELGNLTSLNYLILNNNALTGSIPTELGTMSDLTILWMSANQLTGNIPASLGNLANLTQLRLEINQLSGNIPTELSNLTELKNLQLYNNQFSGNIPLELGSLDKLTTLRLENNQLTGSIPSELGNLSSLNTLWLYSNQLSNSIPVELSNLNNLTSLYLNNNTLNGNLPESLGSLTNLKSLFLNNNQFTGSIPASFGNMVNLEKVGMNQNQLTGNIPEQLGNWTQLLSLNLSQNQLSGSIPASFGNFVNLTSLHLYDNQLSGEIPETFNQLSSLEVLYLRDNELSGSIPDLSNSLSLKTAYLYSNNLTSVPDYSNHPNASNLTFQVQKNHIPLGDIEANLSGLNTFNYSPQYSQSEPVQEISQPQEESLTINPIDVSTNNTYFWEKQDSNGNWIDLTSKNEDTTGSTFTQNTSTNDDSGLYRYTVSNNLINQTLVYQVHVEVYDPVQQILEKYAFQYQYDNRQRMTHKQVPGSGTVYMVYDDRDRLVLTQDANQRADNKWLFTKYDGLNRPILTGIYTHIEEATQAEMQLIVNTFYLDSSNEWNESRDNTATLGYTNASYPLGISTDDYLTVTYYDTYSFTDNPDWTMSVDLTDAQTQAKTFVTGTMTKVLGEGEDNGWNQSSTLYDNRYRVKTVKTQDYQGNTDQLESQYYSLVHPLVIETEHTHTHGSSGASTTLTETFNYDHADRLLSVTHQINDETPVTLVTNEYNELGELTKKKLHADGESYKQEIDYAYNIRGWLTKINNPSTDDPTEKYFSMHLKYTDATTPQYNGNIGESDWTNPFETATHNYDYNYDAMNRLQSATYSSSQANTRDYTVNNINYDLNGNILTLDRLGDQANGTQGNLPGQSIDELAYTYDGNQLRSVADNSNSETGFTDRVTATVEYLYDANGNMIEDKNKNITQIKYNYLNLPTEVTIAATDSEPTQQITYIYDAAGTKHAKIVYEDGISIKRTDYRGPFIYETNYEGETGNENLQFINHAEGRIVIANNSEATYDYQYHLKDHLGNVRNTFTTNPTTDQSIATLETAQTSEETQYFENYDEVTRIQASLFNHTPQLDGVGSQYAMRLNGTTDETIGLVRQLKVKPGDVINLEVYAKYFYHEDHSGITPIINTIAGNILNTAEYIVTESAGVGLATFPFADFFTGDNARTDDDNAPKAYLNYLVFDNNYNQVAGTGFQQISNVAAEDGSDVPHEKLSHTLQISESGYVYIYLSNEEGETNPIDVFFDDFKVEQQHTPILQKDDYYPYGLAFNSYTSGQENLYKYNGKEEQKETGLLDYGLRQYDPSIARWGVIDSRSDKYHSWSPYNYVLGNPISNIDPNGDTVTIQVTNNIVGTTMINLFSSGEVAAGTTQETKEVNVYEVILSNESGSSATFYFTREGHRKDADNPTEDAEDVTFDVREDGDSFQGKIKSRWSGTDNVLELRALDDINNQSVEAMKGGVDATRTAIQFHLKGATDGCQMCVGSGQFNSTAEGATINNTDIATNSGGSQSNFMQKIKDFRAADVEAGYSNSIKVNFSKME